MSDLQNILIAAKAGLSPWEQIPQSRWARIASSCGTAELAEIRERIAKLQAELQAVEEWDGDTRDDIHQAIYFFRGILSLGDQQR